MSSQCYNRASFTRVAAAAAAEFLLNRKCSLKTYSSLERTVHPQPEKENLAELNRRAKLCLSECILKCSFFMPSDHSKHMQSI